MLSEPKQSAKLIKANGRESPMEALSLICGVEMKWWQDENVVL